MLENACHWTQIIPYHSLKASQNDYIVKPTRV